MPSFRVDDAVDLAHEDQLVGIQCDRRGGGNVLHQQVESVAGGGVADVGQQHDQPVVEREPDHLRVHLAHQAAVDEVHAVDDADRPRQDEIAGNDAHTGIGHGRVRQSLGEAGFHIQTDLAGRFLGAFQRHLIGDPHVVVVARLLAAQAQLFVDLRAATVDDHDPHAHGVQQAHVLDEGIDSAVDDHLAGDADDERLAAKTVDVGRHPSQPGDELIVGKRRGSRHCGGLQRVRRGRRDRQALRGRGWDRIVHLRVIIILS